MTTRTIGRGSASDSDVETPEEQWARFRMAANRADMRIEVVKRAINQGALAGMDSEVSDYAAWLVVDALDSFDADAEQRSYAQGFRQGVAVGQMRRTPCGEVSTDGYPCELLAGHSGLHEERTQHPRGAARYWGQL